MSPCPDYDGKGGWDICWNRNNPYHGIILSCEYKGVDPGCKRGAIPAPGVKSHKNRDNFRYIQFADSMFKPPNSTSTPEAQEP